MLQLELLAAWFAAGYRRAARAVTHDDRGDVPGWVMVTVMTAGLVVVIFAVFRDQKSSYSHQGLSAFGL